MQLENELQHMQVREIIPYTYEDLVAYISAAAFMGMAALLLLILSL